jgi:hypothetical protein
VLVRRGDIADEPESLIVENSVPKPIDMGAKHARFDPSLPILKGIPTDESGIHTDLRGDGSLRIDRYGRNIRMG